MVNRIQKLLDIQYPVIQAPMTYIARAELAAAVSEAGGLGMVETLTEQGRADLHRVRQLTSKPVAANLMVQGWEARCFHRRCAGRCRGHDRVHLSR